jgi:prepilin-type N-terminal cleavage/methylation domain-containing protein
MQVFNNKNKGFTLVELMVATSLFVVIMLSAMGSLFVLLKESKESRALRVSMDNVNFAMESMARSIRMGTNYYCGDTTSLDDTLSCPNGGDEISFIPQDASSRVKYSLVDRKIIRDEPNGDSVSIISPDVDIEFLKFFVRVPGGADTQIQPSVYITLKGTVKVNGVPTSFALQTLASQRNFK